MRYSCDFVDLVRRAPTVTMHVGEHIVSVFVCVCDMHVYLPSRSCRLGTGRTQRSYLQVSHRNQKILTPCTRGWVQ